MGASVRGAATGAVVALAAGNRPRANASCLRRPGQGSDWAGAGRRGDAGAQLGLSAWSKQRCRLSLAGTAQQMILETGCGRLNESDAGGCTRQACQCPGRRADRDSVRPDRLDWSGSGSGGSRQPVANASIDEICDTNRVTVESEEDVHDLQRARDVGLSKLNTTPCLHLKSELSSGSLLRRSFRGCRVSACR
jgi:hypothetical protein